MDQLVSKRQSFVKLPNDARNTSFHGHTYNHHDAIH